MCAHCPPSAIRNHVGGDGGAAPRASSDHYQLLPGFGRQRAQGLLSSVIENQGNRLAKIRQTFLARLSLPIGAWHFSAIPDIPWAVLLDDRREFVAHFFILPLRRRSRICFDPESAWPVHREAPATEAGRNAGCVACPRNPRRWPLVTSRTVFRDRVFHALRGESERLDHPYTRR